MGSPLLLLVCGSVWDSLLRHPFSLRHSFLWKPSQAVCSEFPAYAKVLELSLQVTFVSVRNVTLVDIGYDPGYYPNTPGKTDVFRSVDNLGNAPWSIFRYGVRLRTHTHMHIDFDVRCFFVYVCMFCISVHTGAGVINGRCAPFFSRWGFLPGFFVITYHTRSLV